MPIRDDFPELGSTYSNGYSDGWEYKTIFAGSNLVNNYEMVIQFLKEEGYGDVPIPKDAQELLCFRDASNRGQITLFHESGYVHNPIKILFNNDKKFKNSLVLCLYNEKEEHHLLKFHGLYYDI